MVRKDESKPAVAVPPGAHTAPAGNPPARQHVTTANVAALGASGVDGARAVNAQPDIDPQWVEELERVNAELERENAKLRRELQERDPAAALAIPEHQPVQRGRDQDDNRPRFRFSEGVMDDLRRVGTAVDPGTGFLLSMEKDSDQVTVTNRLTGAVSTWDPRSTELTEQDQPAQADSQPRAARDESRQPVNPES